MSRSPDDTLAAGPPGEATSSEEAASEQPVPVAGPAVQREWLRRIEAEYTSSAHTAELALWLIRLGAPRELIDDALRIVADELDHAELSAAVCAAAGEQALPTLRRDRLALPMHDERLPERCLHACLEVFCLGETVAVPLFVELRRECTVAVARRALDRILRDEVRHRQFGWDLLEYLLDTYPALREEALAHLPQAMARIKRRYARAGSREGQADGDAADRAWGLMAPGLYHQILRATWTTEYKPRFAELGLPIQDW